MIRFVVSIFVALGTTLLLFANCEDGLRCSGDRTCIQNFGQDFVCYQNQCTSRTKLELPKDEPIVKDKQTEPLVPDQAPDKTEPRSEPRPEPPTPDIKPVDDFVKPDTSPIKQKGLEQPCLDYAHAPPEKKCGAGLKCVRLSALTAFCFQDCSKNSAICSANQDGRTTCRVIGWNTKDSNQQTRICVKLRKEGETCDSQQSQYCALTGGPPLTCSKGTCQKGKLCTVAGCSCEKGAGKPLVECDIKNGLTCDSSSHTCTRGYRAFEGEPCGLYKGVNFICEEGYGCECTEGANCFGGNARPKTCHKKCDPKNPISSCSHRRGFVCNTNKTKQSYCIQENCGKQQDCAHQSYSHICDGKAGSRHCLPLPTPGPIGMGGICEPTNGKACQHPYTCITTASRKEGNQTIPVGFCTLQCDKATPPFGDEVCAKYGGTATCTLLNSQTRLQLCGWTCSGGKKCPDRYRCIPNSNVCLP